MKCDGCSGKSCCGSEENSHEETKVKEDSFIMLFKIFPVNACIVTFSL